MSNLAPTPDPQTAWQPWQSTESEPWDRRLAAHLFRRASFGASRAQLDEAVTSSPHECVDHLLNKCQDAETRAFDAEMTTMAAGLVAGEPQTLEPWWLYRMLFTPASLRERMTLFWHGHFATSAATVNNTSMMLAQNETLRQHALGHFEPLVQAVSRDPAMLTYLNSTTNARIHPNENYAREVMELFCLGVGNYTERDIQETARCFTGWEIRRKRFRFNKHQHDFGTKSLFHQTGKFDGDDAVRIILAQDAAPRFIARKLVNYFVCDHPVSDELVEPLARELRDNDFHIEPVVCRILTSRYFYSQAAVGQKIRSPVDLAIGLLRCLEGTVGTIALAAALQPLGQRVFFPPNVKGWEGGRKWINATTLIGRVNLVSKLLRNDHVRFADGSLTDYFQDSETSAKLVDTLAGLLLAVPLPDSARRELIRVAQFHKNKVARGASDVLCTLAALPEFQLG
ncbi:MAG: DUF1800 domain-containing protein [Planctomycetes bacterium]|nr:DUF1800 domain-containing protein [Planctomycetota bacterium]